jgi:hypothetical protein
MQLSSATPLAETENLDVYPAAPEGFNVARENIPARRGEGRGV